MDASHDRPVVVTVLTPRRETVCVRSTLTDDITAWRRIEVYAGRAPQGEPLLEAEWKGDVRDQEDFDWFLGELLRRIDKGHWRSFSSYAEFLLRIGHPEIEPVARRYAAGKFTPEELARDPYGPRADQRRQQAQELERRYLSPGGEPAP